MECGRTGGDLFLFTHLTVEVSVFIYLFRSSTAKHKNKTLNRTPRAGELRSTPSGPDDWYRVAG